MTQPDVDRTHSYRSCLGIAPTLSLIALAVEHRAKAMEEREKLQDGNQGPPQSPTTKHLMDVSRILSTDWKMLVREMDIPDSEINAIVERYKFDEPWEQKYQCLRYWLNTKGEHASFKELIEAARKRGQANLAREIEAISKGEVAGGKDREEPPVNLVNKFLAKLHSPISRKRRTSFANVHSKSVDSVLSPDTPSMSENSPKPSDPPPPVEITKESSQTPTAEVLDLRHFWPYHCLRHVQAHLPVLSTVIRIFLLFLVILQLLFSMLVFAFSVYHTANKHSCISSEKWFFMFVTVFLYFFTRGLLPLITVWAFSSAVVKNLGIQSSSLASEFLEAISRKENESVLQAVVRTFWDVGLAKKTYSTILQTLTQHFAKELGVMCITSTLEAAIITTMLIQVGATRFALDAYSIPFGGVLEVVIESLDALSYFALILTIGIICSFFNHEATMNRLVAGAVALEDHADTFGVEPSKELIQSAKNTVNNFNNSWNISEIFLFLSVQVYTLILVFFVGAGLPLSCGITAHMHTEQIHLYWFPFVIIFSVGHFLSTCVWPSAHGALEYRVIGVLLEASLLAVLYIVQPPLFGSFLQILFAVMPSAYLFWYLWMKVHYENSVRSAKPKEWRRPHERNIGIYICLMAQLVGAIVLSIISEYSIIRLEAL